TDAETNRVGHAWARFTDQNSERTIADVAQHYCGLLENAPARGWPYNRDDEVRQARPEIYLRLTQSSSGTPIRQVIETGERTFKPSDLTPGPSNRLSSIIVPTASGNRYFIGYDAQTRSTFVLNEKDLEQGQLAKRIPTEDFSIRVATPIDFSTAEG